MEEEGRGGEGHGRGALEGVRGMGGALEGRGGMYEETEQLCVDQW